MPQYMLLLFADPSQGPAEGSPEAMAEWQAWGTYTQGLKDAGAFVSGEPLEPPTTATTVAMRNGDRVVTDGPFAETKEWLGGYYVIEAADLDAALDHASRIPNAGYGHVEVRPVMQVPGMEQRRRAGLPRGVRSRPGHADPPSRRRLQLAEDALQDAFAVALATWPRDGVPDNPGAWITTAARRKAIDRLRRERALADRLPTLRR